jgi:hypothetical protein
VPFPELFAEGKSLKFEGIACLGTKIRVYMAIYLCHVDPIVHTYFSDHACTLPIHAYFGCQDCLKPEFGVSL